MRTTTQFSVFLVNKPGVLAQLISAVADAKINVVALTISESQEHGVMRVVGNDPKRLRAVLAKLNLPIHETDVLVVELPNRPGALATIVGKLARQHVNIQYAYVTAGAPGGKTTGILKVSNLANVEKMLKTTKKKSLTKRSTVKRQPSGRRR